MEPMTHIANRLHQKKQVLREQLIESRVVLQGSVAKEKSRVACRQVESMLKNKSSIAIYSAKGAELDPKILAQSILAKGGKLFFPRVVVGQAVLEFCRIETLDSLVEGRFGLLEPATHILPIDAHQIDAFVIPGLGFDAKCQRIGWGKGYYDNTLAKYSQALRIGICFQEQIVPLIPTGSVDEEMDWVFTDTNTYKNEQARLRHCPGNI